MERLRALVNFTHPTLGALPARARLRRSWACMRSFAWALYASRPDASSGCVLASVRVSFAYHYHPAAE